MQPKMSLESLYSTLIGSNSHAILLIGNIKIKMQQQRSS